MSKRTILYYFLFLIALSSSVLLILLYTNMTWSQTRQQYNVNKVSTTASLRTLHVHKKQYAYVFTVTEDGPFIDGAAVLIKSIQQNHGSGEYDIYAVVHLDANTTLPKLERLGVKIRLIPTPIDVNIISNTYYRTALLKSGCCGEKELIKLEIFRMVEYERVILLDTDMILNGSLEGLLSKEKQLLFTYDRAMTSDSLAKPCIQGGFLVVKPSIHDYKLLVKTIEDGNFYEGTGWGGFRLGWCYGGQTIQGLMSYYENIILGYNASMEVDSCRFDGMGISVNHKEEDCANVSASSITLFHFTACPKPWMCISQLEGICKEMTDKWFQYRRLVEIDHEGSTRKKDWACKTNEYQSIFKSIL